MRPGRSTTRRIATAAWLIGGTLFAGAALAQSSSLFGGQEFGAMKIDILPESEENLVGKRSKRVLPVALFGAPDLDVNVINPRTITLEGVDVMLVGKSDKSLCRQTDIDGDGHLDLLCDVRTTGFRVEAGEYTIVIKTETYDKDRLRGEDRIRVVP